MLLKQICAARSPIKLIVLEFSLYIDEKKNVKIMLGQMFKGGCGILNRQSRYMKVCLISGGSL